MSTASPRLTPHASRLTALPAHPLRWARARIDAWVLGRVRKQAGPVEVARNRVYIVPTRFGWGFALMLLVMLLGAMNYSNSMAFALTFLLGGLGLVCMHHTHANLVHVLLRIGRARPVYAGEAAHFEWLIDNPAAHPRYALACAWSRAAPQGVAVDVPAQSFAGCTLSVETTRRGWLEVGIVEISTEFPLGLFHAWTWVHLDARCLVFPQPGAAGVPPPLASGEAGASGQSRSGQDEFSGLRNYQRGDALRSIHWKSLPKTAVPMVKQFSESVAHSVWLDWNLTPGHGTEEKLSRLCRWVLDADAEGRVYGLDLPGIRIAPGQGESHRFECLKALALFDRAPA